MYSHKKLYVLYYLNLLYTCRGQILRFEFDLITVGPKLTFQNNLFKLITFDGNERSSQLLNIWDIENTKVMF